MGAQPSMDVGVRLRVTLSQVGVDDIPGDVVRPQPGGVLLDEGQVAQPFPQLRHLVVGDLRQTGAQHRFGGARSVGADLERLAVQSARCLVDDPLQQRGDHIGQVAQARRHAQRTAPQQRIDQQGRGERMPVGQRHHPIQQPAGQTLHVEQRPNRLRAEIAQPDHLQQVPPAGIGAPSLTRWTSAGDHHEGRCGQGGQQIVAQPVLGRPQLLDRVEDDHDPGVLIVLLAETERAGERGPDAGGGRCDPAAIEFGDPAAGRSGLVGVRAQQT